MDNKSGQNDSLKKNLNQTKPYPEILKEYQICPQCGGKIGVVAGSKEAICKKCGFKDPCCE